MVAVKVIKVSCLEEETLRRTKCQYLEIQEQISWNVNGGTPSYSSIMYSRRTLHPGKVGHLFQLISGAKCVR